MDILFLNQQEISNLLTMKDVIQAVESALKEKGEGKVEMPPKTYLYYKKYSGDLRVMPSYMVKSEKSGVKVVNSHANNPRTKNLPTVMAVIILIDPSTGSPLAIMDGTLITAWRTGAAAGVAVKYLARKESRVLGLVGAGRQAQSQLEAITEVMDLVEVKVCDHQRDVVDRFIANNKKLFDLNFTSTKSDQECVEGADIVSSQTPSRSFIIKDDWVRQGTHINAIGADAPGKQEIDPALLNRAKVLVDDWEQACHSGEVNVPLSQGIFRKEQIYGELSEVVCNLKVGRESDSEITVFDSTGLSIQDVATASLIYEKAKKMNVGKWLTLF
ncbi:alanine dehydrogenase [[Eubacterium] cellulosolvens]